MTNAVGKFSVKDLLNRVLGGILANGGSSLRTNVYPLHEGADITPGAGQDGYNAKVTGGMFGTVTTSYHTTITNNDAAETITIFLNVDNAHAITLTSGDSMTFDMYGVTNIFIDTTAQQTGDVQITLFGE